MVIYENCTEMHGQQNIKSLEISQGILVRDYGYWSNLRPLATVYLISVLQTFPMYEFLAVWEIIMRASPRKKKEGCKTLDQTVSHRSLIMEARVRSQVHVRSVVDKVALGQVSLPVRPSSLVNIISPKFHTHHLHVAFTRRINGRNLGTFQKKKVLSQTGRHQT